MFLKNVREQLTRRIRGAAGRKSLAWRLTVWYTASSFVLLLGATVALYAVLDWAFHREADEFLMDNVLELAAIIRTENGGGEHLRRDVEDVISARHYAQVYVRVLRSDGSALLETPDMPVELHPQAFPPAVPQAEATKGTRVDSAKGGHFRALAAVVAVDAEGREGRVVQVACDRRRETEILGRYRAYSWSMLGIAFLACAAISYVLAHRGIRPVHEIAAAARQVHAETLDKRLRTEDLPAELRTLAETFNEMLDRLSDSFKRLSQFSADIAHELRTPVNNLRGELEVALGKTRSPQEYEEVLFSTLEECERLSRLVDQLLFIARAEHTESTAEFQRVNVAHELSAVGGFYDAVAGEGGVRLTTVCAPGLEADLNSELFRCAVGNLVANAIAHTPPSGEVSISVAIADGALHVNVSDTGCGIAPEEMARVFDRFYRADRARGNKGGFGLGLSIVRSIAQLHRGSVELSSPPGQGTRVTIRFPLRHTAGGAAAGA